MKNDNYKPSNNAFKPRTLVEARCGLKASESDIFDMLLSYINRSDDDPGNLTYTLVVNDFKDKFGLKYAENSYKKIRDGVTNLKGKTIDIWSDDGKIFESYVLFQSIKWNNRCGTVTVKLGEDIKSMIVQQKQSITYYEIRYTLPMSSRYSKRLYVMFKEWAQSKNKQRYDRVDELREKLKVPKSYKYNDFKTSVLNVALSEINNTTDLTVSFKEHLKPVRGGMKVVGLTFDIQEKVCVTDVVERQGSEMLLGYLLSKGVTSITRKQAVIIYRAAQKGKLTDRQIKNRVNIVLNKKDVYNLAGYLIFAMSEKFKTPKALDAGFKNFEGRAYSREWFQLFEKNMLAPECMSQEELQRFHELTEDANCH
ncbi:MAG: replication initiation protein [Ruminococcus flavefaciens]|nr:replication initiation protein [Ruminococcus flavefaciens]